MRIPVILALVAVVILGLMGSVFVVPEGKTAIVENLGRVQRWNLKPGLHFKVPLVESTRTFDRRFRVLETKPGSYYTREQKTISIDFFAVGQISDSRTYFLATGGQDTVAADRLAPIITDALKNEINARTLQQLVSGDRSEIVAKQLPIINRGAATLGMHITDIRLKQIDLPPENNVLNNVYDRMRAQRKQVASKARAEGEEQALTIRAKADRDSTVLLAEAERDAKRLQGEGDAEAARIYAEAAGKDPGFFAFQRSLDAYRASFADGQGVIVLDKDDPFLQYMKSDR